MQPKEREQEEHFLKKCIEIIGKNFKKQEEELTCLKKENKILYDNYRSDNPELHNDLVIGLDRERVLVQALEKSERALNKPYFGRIDYLEHEEEQTFSFYIGKQGVLKEKNEILIVDWRAPISSVYYDSDLGETSYLSPFGEEILIELFKKRTFEIEKKKLIQFYDTDVIANDEFLSKYLSKNKEVILGEIIATIQKEQNQIIRDTPWHSVLVQGVAGSGKTTVAMHRISYLLYNYKESLAPDEFYIIGSNTMLLNYITGILPNLDVHHVPNMTMIQFFLLCLDTDLPWKKKKYTIVESYEQKGIKFGKMRHLKGSITFSRAFVQYYKRYEKERILPLATSYQGISIKTEELEQFLETFSYLPLCEKIDLLNKRFISKIGSYLTQEGLETEQIRMETAKYKNYFGKKTEKMDYLAFYRTFLQSLLSEPDFYKREGILLPPADIITCLIQEVDEKRLDIYDLGILALAKYFIKITKDFSYVRHIVVDEVQDFGVCLFDLMKRLFPNATFTLMGDVSQNIFYDSGMNDWETLYKEVFDPERDKFYVLSKSYRNTIEISEFATRILRKCSFKTYEVEPILRHGNPVQIFYEKSEQAMYQRAVTWISSMLSQGFDTLAFICSSVEESDQVRTKLSKMVEGIKNESSETLSFERGILVLPIHLTKGLEFDAVLLFNPTKEVYPYTDASAKLLYVAITRALHEFAVLVNGELSELF